MLCCLIPTVSLVILAMGGEDGRPSMFHQAPGVIWGHIWQTLLLAAIVIPGCLTVGWGAAWAVTRFEFPGRKWFSALLCSPFAIPSHVFAGIWERASYSPYIPQPEGIGATGLILILTLYPWAYLPGKLFFTSASSQYDELALSLRMNWWQRLKRVHLGLASPALIASGLLVFMAIIGDYGTANLLAVKTLSAGIHDAQAGMMRPDWAAQIALVGLALPLLAVVLLEWTGARKTVYSPTNRAAAVARKQSPPAIKITIIAALSLMLLFALILPIATLASWAVYFIERLDLSDIPGQIIDTFTITLATTVITVSFALLFTLAQRRHCSLAWWRHLSPLFVLNFAIPGIMIGIGLLGISNDIILSNSPTLLILGCCVAVVCFPVLCLQAGSAGIRKDIDELCTTLNLGGRRRLMGIDLPLLRPAIAVGALLVIVTVIKELPIAEILQPYGFRSLSLRVYNFTGVGSYQIGSIHALTLIGLSVYPVFALDRLLMSGREESAP